MNTTLSRTDLISAARDLLTGIFWLRDDGPMQAANLAHAGKHRIFQIDLKGQMQALKFRSVVRQATRGSCLKWDAEAVEHGLKEFVDAQESETTESVVAEEQPTANFCDGLHALVSGRLDTVRTFLR